MAIKLRVISDQARDMGEQRSRVFGVNGGTVGRARDNDWVLPDPRRIVSGHHFVVLYNGGKYWLEDVSTNGVYVNGADDPASLRGRIELREGDRLRLGDYELLVSLDDRFDFLPASAEKPTAPQHLEQDMGHPLDLDSLFTPREPGDSGSYSLPDPRGLRLNPDSRAALIDALQSSVEALREGPSGSAESVVPDLTPPVGGPAPSAAPNPDWAMRTRQIPREALSEATGRRAGLKARVQQPAPLHAQAAAWPDLRSAVQAFCRGAGIDPASLSPDAQTMLPLIAGQLLREAVVGLADVAQARSAGPAGAQAAAVPPAPGSSSNPLRNSRSVEETLQRLFESHGRRYGGPVDALRDVLQEARDHEAAVAAAMKAGLQAVLDQLSPTNVADQFEQGRARILAPGQDPRPKYWEHYAEFHRLVSQQAGPEELPHAFLEAFAREYERVRAEQRSRRRGTT
jgi:type VI secretion system protein